VSAVSTALDDSGVEIDDIGLHRPTLDEVFLRLTGSIPTDEEPPA
jgi:ABC-2 type transport system ATP-binding protein